MQDNIITYILIGILLIFIYLFIKNSVKQCPSNKIMIIYGRKGTVYPYKAVYEGFVFVIPLIQSVQFLDLTVFSKDIRLKAKDENNKDFNLNLSFTFSVSNEPAVLNNAVEYLIGLPEIKVEKFGANIIESNAKMIVESNKFKKYDHLKLENDFSQEIVHELEKVGLKLININIIFS